VNTPQQLELTDWKAPADAAEVDQLVRLLAAAGTWLTAEEITQQLSWTDRKIRIPMASSSPATPGINTPATPLRTNSRNSSAA
jgi:hypothetical protein